jgi:hypothetical protein
MEGAVAGARPSSAKFISEWEVRMRRLILVLACASLALCQKALAQNEVTQRVRGQIVSVSANALTLKVRGGDKESIALTPDWSVIQVKAVDVNTIQPGSFIGTTEMERPDGTGRSLEVHVFPPGVKMGEGHYDWDLQPKSKMTNGTVGKVTAGHNGRELEVAYPGGARHVVVPKNVPVVLMEAGDRSLVRAGASVFIVAARKPDGGLIANHIVVGENGASPPM